MLGVARSAAGRVWRHRLDAIGEAMAATMAERHNLDGTLARVLAGRGVTPDEAPGFLDPTLKALLPDPSTLTDMDNAAERFAAAIIAGRKIALFGDYDVDGAATAAMVTRWLRALGLELLAHIPDRLIEGYGPNDAIAALVAAEMLVYARLRLDLARHSRRRGGARSGDRRRRPPSMASIRRRWRRWSSEPPGRPVGAGASLRRRRRLDAGRHQPGAAPARLLRQK